MTHINTKKKPWMLMLHFYSSNIFSYVPFFLISYSFPTQALWFPCHQTIKRDNGGNWESVFSDIGMTLGGFVLWVTNNLLIILLRDAGPVTIPYPGCSAIVNCLTFLPTYKKCPSRSMTSSVFPILANVPWGGNMHSCLLK